MKKTILLTYILLLTSCAKEFHSKSVKLAQPNVSVKNKLFANTNVKEFQKNPDTFTFFFFPKVGADINWVPTTDKEGKTVDLYSINDSWATKISAMTTNLLSTAKNIDTNDKATYKLVNNNALIKKQMINDFTGCWDEEEDAYLNTPPNAECEAKFKVFKTNNKEMNRLSAVVKSGYIRDIQTTIDNVTFEDIGDGKFERRGTAVNWQDYGTAAEYKVNLRDVWIKREKCVASRKKVNDKITSNNSLIKIVKSDVAYVEKQILNLDPADPSRGAKLAELNKKKSELVTKLESLNSKRADLNKEIGKIAICNTVKGQQKTVELSFPTLGSATNPELVTKLKEEQKDLKEIISSAKAELKELKNTADTFQTDVRDLAKEIRTNTAKIDAISEKIKAIQKDGNAYATYSAKKVEKTNKRIIKQYTKIDKKLAEIDDLDTTTDTYANDLKGLTNDLIKLDLKNDKYKRELARLKKPAIVNVTYDYTPLSPGTKLLTFTVKEKGSDSEYTGRTWEVLLEHIDFAGKVRFQGDVVVPSTTKANHIEQRGSMKFELAKSEEW
jgi:hypothetical protein